MKDASEKMREIEQYYARGVGAPTERMMRNANAIVSRDAIQLCKCLKQEGRETFRGTLEQLLRHIRQRKKAGSIGQYAADRMGNGDHWRLLEPKNS